MMQPTSVALLLAAYQAGQQKRQKDVAACAEQVMAEINEYLLRHVASESADQDASIYLSHTARAFSKAVLKDSLVTIVLPRLQKAGYKVETNVQTTDYGNTVLVRACTWKP